MKIGMVSDSLGHLTFKKILDTARELGISGVEVNALPSAALIALWSAS